jgi:hypothetical protein
MSNPIDQNKIRNRIMREARDFEARTGRYPSAIVMTKVACDAFEAEMMTDMGQTLKTSQPGNCFGVFMGMHIHELEGGTRDTYAWGFVR